MSENRDESTTRTVLCVEDNAASRKLLEVLLRQWDSIRVLSAETGKEGLRLAEAHRPDLILLDLNLPDMDGYEFMRFLRSTSWGGKIPVTAVTAAAMTHEVRFGKDSSFVDYLTKPLDLPRFRSLVNSILQ